MTIRQRSWCHRCRFVRPRFLLAADGDKGSAGMGCHKIQRYSSLRGSCGPPWDPRLGRVLTRHRVLTRQPGSHKHQTIVANLASKPYKDLRWSRTEFWWTMPSHRIAGPTHAWGLVSIDAAVRKALQSLPGPRGSPQAVTQPAVPAPGQTAPRDCRLKQWSQTSKTTRKSPSSCPLEAAGWGRDRLGLSRVGMCARRDGRRVDVCASARKRQGGMHACLGPSAGLLCRGVFR